MLTPMDVISCLAQVQRQMMDYYYNVPSTSSPNTL